MAYVKISELPVLNETVLPLTAGDVMPLVHGSVTYKVQLSTLNTYFSPQSAAGNDTQIQFNANGRLSAVPGFTYDPFLSSFVAGSLHDIEAANSAAIGGVNSQVLSNESVSLGSNNIISNENSFTIGSNLRTNEPNYTYVNNLSVQGAAVVNSTLEVGEEASIGGDLTIGGTLSANGGVYYTEARPHLVYVAQNGDDSNVGTNPSQPFRTIKKACQYVSQHQELVFPVTPTIGVATYQYTIFVMTGDYTEENPIYVPQQTSIIGDNLRRCTIRPTNRTYDILWLNSGCYVWGFTFRDHLEPAAATAFPNLDSTKTQFQVAFNTSGYEIYTAPNDYYRLQKPYIILSPYTQGNTSYTSAIVAPQQTAVTQTISATRQISFGNILSNTASARVAEEFQTFMDIILTGESPPTLPLNLGNVPANSQTVISAITANRSTIQNAATAYISATYPLLFPNPTYQYAACYRDAGYILDCVVADLQTGSNARIVEAANVYYVGTLSASGTPPSTPLPAYEIYPAIWNYIKLYTISSLNLNVYPNASFYVATEFDTLTSILNLGQYTTAINSTDPVTGDMNDAANLLETNRLFFQNELTAYVDNVFSGFAYGQSTAAAALTAKTKCYRDMGWIIDAIKYDLRTGTNARAITYANSYYLGARSRIANQEITTAATVGYGGYLASFVIGNSAVETTPSGCGIRVDGSLARGFLRSFVTDSYTQINEGGIGIHITNNGYAQLVSTFTICCEEGIRADNGGQCSINTSNCSFGLSGLVAVGKSPTTVLSGKLLSAVDYNSDVLTVSGLFPRLDTPDYSTYPVPITVPYVGLVFTVDGDVTNTLYVLTSASLINPTNYTYNIQVNQPIRTTLNALSAVKFYIRSQITTGSHTFEYIGSGNVLSRAIPALGGVANPDNEARASGGGAVYFTATNHLGNFKVGNDFTIVQETGIIEGRTFQRSILALVTPLTLALE